MSWYYGFRPYVSVAKRRANAAREMAKLAKKGRVISPIKIAGRKITQTFWGNAWCDNLESYSDFENRLPRGRTYVRNGSVVDLQIKPGKVTAIVSGSELYNVDIDISPLPSKRWKDIKCRCAGQIASVVALLQGRLSEGVMQIITCQEGGLFPSPKEIRMDCSCPDSAGMCKHIAAVMYGIGARLDEKPELLFTLRKVDHFELIEQAASVDRIVSTEAGSRKTIAAGEVADVFGIEVDAATTTSRDDQPQARPAARAIKSPRTSRGKKKSAVRKPAMAME